MTRLRENPKSDVRNPNQAPNPNEEALASPPLAVSQRGFADPRCESASGGRSDNLLIRIWDFGIDSGIRISDFGFPAYHAGMSTSASSSLVDPELLEMLRCPLTRSKLRPEGEFLVAEVGGLSYPVRDGIPVMLIEEAKLPPGVESLAALKAKLNLP
jgi:uncharacterized protein YbaR (Trm112 family)